jgi:hypothetical protein
MRQWRGCLRLLPQATLSPCGTCWKSTLCECTQGTPLLGKRHSMKLLSMARRHLCKSFWQQEPLWMRKTTPER